MPTAPFPKPMQKRKGALLRRGLFVAALFLAGTSARAGTQWTGPESVIGEWDFLLEKSSRRCRLTLTGDLLPSGAQTVGMATTCRRMLPVLAEIDGWTLRDGDFIGLLDRAGQTILDFTTQSLTANGPRGETYRLVAVAPRNDPRQTDTDPIAALAVPEPGEPDASDANPSPPGLAAPAPSSPEPTSLALSPEAQMANVRAALTEPSHEEPGAAELAKSIEAAPAPAAPEPAPAEKTPPGHGAAVAADPNLRPSQSEPAAPPVQKPSEKVEAKPARPSISLFAPAPLSPKPTHLVPSAERKAAGLNRGFTEPTPAPPAATDQGGAKSSVSKPAEPPPAAKPAPPGLAQQIPVPLSPPARPAQSAETKLAGLSRAVTEPSASATAAQDGAKPSVSKPAETPPVAKPAETKLAGLSRAATEPSAPAPAATAKLKSNEIVAAPAAPWVAPKAAAPVPSRPVPMEAQPEPSREPVKVAARPQPAASLKPSDVAGHYAILREGGKDTGCMLTLNDKTKGRSGDKATLAPACRDQGIVIFDPVGWRIIDGKLVLTARKGHSTQLERQPDGTWSKASKQGKPLALKRL
jgi:hypothetical protein